MVRDEIKKAGSYDTDEGDNILRRFDQWSPNFGYVSLSKHKRWALKRPGNSLSWGEMSEKTSEAESKRTVYLQ